MSSYQLLRDRLPSLYRPEDSDETLLNRFLGATGFALDGASNQLQHVLRAHWFDVADQALWDAHYQTARLARGQPPVNVRDPKDVRDMGRYPYITDLARLCALLRLPPWQEPRNLAETVEEYRARVDDILAGYQLGLTTVPALRRLVEAALPEDMTEVPARQRWPFAIEEPVRVLAKISSLSVPGVEEGSVVAPLARWPQEDESSVPVVYIQGVAAGGLLGSTAQPAFECYTPGALPLGIALGYTGTLVENQTLRLIPARRGWLLLDGVLFASAPENDANGAQDPAANGPYVAIPDAPSGRAKFLAAADDHTLWLVYRAEDEDRLYRYDGSTFLAITEGAPAADYSGLTAYGHYVLLGTHAGLYQCPLYPDEGVDFALQAVANVSEQVHTIGRCGDRLAVAGSDGLALLNDDLSLAERQLPGIGVVAFHGAEERLFVATPKALVVREGGHWLVYEGAAFSENLPDWLPIDDADIADAESPLPPLTAIQIDRDGAVWLGSERGLARYYVRDGRTTLLEAYPDLGTLKINALDLDDRGLLRIVSNAGLFRYDGRDLAQYDFNEHRWQRLGQAASSYPDDINELPRNHWRYVGESNTWERYEIRQRRFADPALPSRQITSLSVSAWCLADSVRADIGDFADEKFTVQQSVDHAQLRVHIKVNETRIVAGGLPALPLPRPGGHWRYLQLEPADLNPPPGRPWWSCEGRLFPPPEAQGPMPGHFRAEAVDSWIADGQFSKAIFAYPPSARLWLERGQDPPIGVRIRLFKRLPEETVDPALVERVWDLCFRAKAAGVPLQLAVEGEVVKGDGA